MNDPARELLSCAAALLDQGRHVDRLSRPLTAASLIGAVAAPLMLTRPPWNLLACLTVAALAGLIEMYFAIRVGFDAALFHQRSAAPEGPAFAGTDAALSALGLLPAAKRGRPADARVTGARRLFRCQILALVAQVLAAAAGAYVAWTWPH